MPADSIVIDEGQAPAHAYTLLSGWAFQFRTLANGKRQILQFLLPGDLVGAQHVVIGNAWHGVRTLTEATFCSLSAELFKGIPTDANTLRRAVCVLLAQDCSALEEQLVSVGQRTALERVAALFLTMFRRAAALQIDRGRAGVDFPATQQHIADTLGLSLVHTNKTIRRLQRLTGCSLKHGRLNIPDLHAVSRVANFYSDGRPVVRPLL
ncbi:MAG: Crp/Fnr family transcriptional regulator [Vicinamibacterales bacterium]